MNRSEAINLALTLFRQDLDRNDLKDTDTFDSMVDKCQDAVNNLLIEDFN